MTAPAHIEIAPITDAARDGRYQVVLDGGGMFALVRWSGESWVFSSNVPLDFEPTHYRLREGAHG